MKMVGINFAARCGCAALMIAMSVDRAVFPGLKSRPGAPVDSGSGQFVRYAIGARQQLSCRGVIQDLLCSGIPVDFPTYQHGNQAQVSGNGRVMPDLHRRDRGLARLYAVEEIPPVLL